MIELPTVRSFCGCIDLRVACIAIASFRLVVSVILLIALLFVFVMVEDSEVVASKSDPANKAAYGFVEFMVALYVTIAVVVVVLNILATYWFIKGVTDNVPTKMKYYILLESVAVVLFVLAIPFNLAYVLPAAIEFYIMLCANSLYQDCLLAFPEQSAVNTTENTVIKFDNVPSPPYNSCENDTQRAEEPQNTTTNPFKG